MRKAVINRGVSVVVLPGDVALKAAPENASTHWYVAPPPTVTPPEEEIKSWRRYCAIPAISPCCAAARGAHAELVQFAAKLKAPVVHALRGKEHVEYDNPMMSG